MSEKTSPNGVKIVDKDSPTRLKSKRLDESRRIVEILQKGKETSKRGAMQNDHIIQTLIDTIINQELRITALENRI